jgi:hypothetical protein
MTRGRPPLVALKEAYGIAMKRGQVLPVSEGRCDQFHFILFSEDQVIFIKVKRMLSDMSDPQEILYNYEREIRHLARVPLNSVDAREFWVRSPRGTFHFFLIGKDRIFGLQADGSVMSGTGYPLEPLTRKEGPAKPKGKTSATDLGPALPAGKVQVSDQAPALPDRKDPAVARTPALPVTPDPIPEQASEEG